MSQHHDIAARSENMVWGYFDATTPPVLEIDSGDTIRLTSWGAADEHELPDDLDLVNPGQLEAMRTLEKGDGGHFITGPVSIKDAQPGDVLQVDILDVSLIDPWGYTAVEPLGGALPYDFEHAQVMHTMIDRNRGIGTLPWGQELELDPFFGVMAVAPPPNWGRCSSGPPRKFGGNMDNKELRAGTTLYLPVFNPGALFFAGDGHAVQGDGEVCCTAIETSLSGSFRLTLRKDLDYAFPFAESESHLISIGLNEDLDEAARQAVREMIDHICRRSDLDRAQAYVLCSLAGDLRVTQTVDGEKGCHMMLAKQCI